VTETGDTIHSRQKLSTTSFEAYELEITVNYVVHIWTGRQGPAVSHKISGVDRWVFSLSSCLSTRASTFQMLSLLHTKRGLLLHGCQITADSLQQTISISKFPTVVGKLTQQHSCTIPF